VQPGFLLSCKKLWYVKLAQLKVQLLNEEDTRENTLLGGRREGFFFFIITSTDVHNVFLGHLTRRNLLVSYHGGDRNMSLGACVSTEDWVQNLYRYNISFYEHLNANFKGDINNQIWI
jgi:hypothetical protein